VIQSSKQCLTLANGGQLALSALRVPLIYSILRFSNFALFEQVVDVARTDTFLGARKKWWVQILTNKGYESVRGRTASSGRGKGLMADPEGFNSFFGAVRMMGWGGGVNLALQFVLGVVIVVPMASQALAGEGYSCTFTQECPTDQACVDYEPQAMQLSRDDSDTDLWSLTGADGTAIPFTKMPFEAEDLRAFVSSSIDPGASAVSLLTVFSDGQAILGIHGIFLTPGSVTHLGTCVPKDG